jgi:transcriptional regulator with XRE-family HTH domain
MTTGHTPVTSRRELAKLLRDLRAQHGLALEEVCAQTGISAGFLSRVERGLRGLGDANAELLGDFYRVPTGLRRRMRQLAQHGRQASWWDNATFPRTIKEYIGLEQSATAISTYGSIVPGLLQTRSYAEATMRGTAFGLDQAIRETAIMHRLRRQEVLDRIDPPWLSVILDESAIHRLTGGADTMRQQLDALLIAGSRPRIAIQILPFSAGAHPGMDSHFVIVSTSEGRTPELVHVEGLSGFRNFEHPKDLGRFDQVWRALSAVALPPAESLDVIADHARSGQLP